MGRATEIWDDGKTKMSYLHLTGLAVFEPGFAVLAQDVNALAIDELQIWIACCDLNV